MRIFKETTGHGKEVILLHGWGVDHRYVAPLVRFLSDHFRVTVVDLPGCGKTGWPSQIVTVHDLADLILPHLPEKAAYIGWSIGGQVAISIAARYPERVQQLVGIATTPKFMQADRWPGMAPPGFRAFFINQSIEAVLRNAYEDEFSEFHPKPPLYYEVIQLLEKKSCQSDIFLKGIDLLDTTDLRKEFQSLQCPIDLIFGKKDACIPMESIDAIKKLNPKTKAHIIQKGGHCLFWSQPDEVNHLLRTILG